MGSASRERSAARSVLDAAQLRSVSASSATAVVPGVECQKGRVMGRCQHIRRDFVNDPPGRAEQ